VRLDVQEATAAYGHTVAIREVSLSVPEGQVVVLLGPNGAGKTTLLSVASGLIAPKSGRILLDHKEVTGRTPDDLVRRGLCHVTEGRAVFPGLSVRDNLRMFAAPGEESAAMERGMEAFPRLGQRLGQIAGTMSGGEQQMLALSRAYVRRAPIVLLDEVSMGLAPIIVDEIFDFFRRIRSEGSSLLIVEQYVSKALAIADIVYVLARGRMVFAGEPEELEESEILAHYLSTDSAAIA
jgi:branched-chain amino acid transport system ATP-binding protein